jgi:hypothetical protein
MEDRPLLAVVTAYSGHIRIYPAYQETVFASCNPRTHRALVIRERFGFERQGLAKGWRN